MNIPNYYDAGMKVVKVMNSCETKQQARSAVKMYERYMAFYKVRLVKEYPDYYLGGISKFEYHPLCDFLNKSRSRLDGIL